jgi:hypothetical protein
MAEAPILDTVTLPACYRCYPWALVMFGPGFRRPGLQRISSQGQTSGLGDSFALCQGSLAVAGQACQAAVLVVSEAAETQEHLCSSLVTE